MHIAFNDIYIYIYIRTHFVPNEKPIPAPPTWIPRPFWTWPTRSSSWRCSPTSTSRTVSCVRWLCVRIWAPVLRPSPESIRSPAGCQRCWWFSPAAWSPTDCWVNPFWRHSRTPHSYWSVRSSGIWCFTRHSILATRWASFCPLRW